MLKNLPLRNDLSHGRARTVAIEGLPVFLQGIAAALHKKYELPICGFAAFRAESLWLSASGIKS
jgi:hypothetical protein